VALGLYERQLSLVVAFLLAMVGMEVARGQLRGRWFLPCVRDDKAATRRSSSRLASGVGVW
jgi:hypothetical protein